jgi:tryptophanyl-tRNA synthetase (EC 6.1.1.2)
MSKQTVLTGITTTGTPHLGNYVGAIRPAIIASNDAQVTPLLFFSLIIMLSLNAMSQSGLGSQV